MEQQCCTNAHVENEAERDFGLYTIRYIVIIVFTRVFQTVARFRARKFREALVWYTHVKFLPSPAADRRFVYDKRLHPLSVAAPKLGVVSWTCVAALHVENSSAPGFIQRGD